MAPAVATSPEQGLLLAETTRTESASLNKPVATVAQGKIKSWHRSRLCCSNERGSVGQFGLERQDKSTRRDPSQGKRDKQGLVTSAVDLGAMTQPASCRTSCRVKKKLSPEAEDHLSSDRSLKVDLGCQAVR